MSIQHTKSCVDYHELTRVACVAYDAQWPNYCHKCYGFGVLGDEPCPVCIENGKCPRCEKQAINEDGDHCSECHWTLNEDSRPAYYDDGDCGCPDPELDAAIEMSRETYHNNMTIDQILAHSDEDYEVWRDRQERMVRSHPRFMD